MKIISLGPSVNSVQKIIESQSDSHLMVAIAELKEYRDTGLLRDGVIRQVAQQIHVELGISTHDSLNIAQSNLIELAAFKWMGNTTLPPIVNKNKA